MENNGVIGVFVEEDGEKTRCSIAVRAEQSGRKLEKQVRREHPDANISLKRMYAFSCKDNVVDVETGLRRILCQKFGLYTPPYLSWESYSVDSADEFMKYIETIVCSIDSITVVQEIV